MAITQNTARQLPTTSESAGGIPSSSYKQPSAEWSYHFLTGVLDKSSVYEQLLGYRPGEIENTLTDWVALLHPEDKAFVQEANNQLFAQAQKNSCAHQPPVQKFRVKNANGEYRWLKSSGYSFVRENEEFVELVGSVEDITDQISYLEQLDAAHQELYRISLKSVSDQGSLEKLLQSIVEKTTTLLGSGRASIWLYNEASGSLKCIDCYNPETGEHSSGHDDPMKGQCSFLDFLEENRSLVANNIAKHSYASRHLDVYQSRGIGAIVCAGIRRENRLAGVISFSDGPGAREWIKDEQHLIEAVADCIALLLEQREHLSVKYTLQMHEQRYGNFFHNSNEGIWFFDIEPPVPLSLPLDEQREWLLTHNKITDCNEAFANIHARQRSELIGKNFTEVINAEYDGNMDEFVLLSENRFSRVGGTYWSIDANNQRKYIQYSLNGIIENNTLVGMTGIQTDLSQSRLEDERRRAFIDASQDAMAVFELNEPLPLDLPIEEQKRWIFKHFKCVECNSAYEKLLGLPKHEFLNRLGIDFFGNHDELTDLLLKNNFTLKDYVTSIKTGDGSVRWTSSNAFSSIFDNKLSRLFVVNRDVTETVQATEQLQHQANFDTLTGLPNRKQLNDTLDQALAAAPKDGGQLALLLIDLDGFKEINDTLGHEMGDNLLKKLGPRLNSATRNKNFVARLGGDEFAVIVNDCNDLREVKALAETIHDAIQEPFEFDDYRLGVGSSIGVAVYPDHGEDASELMRCADIAMYAAKGEEDKYRVYDPSNHNHSPRRLSLLTELGGAIQNNQMVLYYQPKIRLGDKKIVGYEALTRWQHPTLGLVPPAEFIPLAEVSSLIRPLTWWVIETALTHIKVLEHRGEAANISVNIAAQCLLDDDLLEKLTELLSRYQVAPQKLELEITESSLMTDPDRAKAVLDEIHAMGIAISIDDFGTGYSSLAYLKQLPIDKLKIDRSFILQMHQHEEDRIIVSSTITLAHNLGMEVVAEGIESAEIEALLVGMGCDQAQGYYYGRPVPAE